MEKNFTIYEPTFIEDENGIKWLLQDPNTTRYFTGEIISYINNGDNYIFIIMTGMPYDRNISYDIPSNAYKYNRLVKYNYKENEFTDDVRPEDLKQQRNLDEDFYEMLNIIKKTRTGNPKQIQYTKKITNKSA